MKSIYLSLILSFFILGGCASYPLQSKKEIISTESISSDRFKVSFCGNAYMDQKDAEKYAMQRACELVLKKGFTHFTVVKKTDESELCLLQDAPRELSTSGMGRVASGSSVGPQNLIRPNITLLVQCYGTNPPADAINAQEYLNQNFPGLQFSK